MSAPGPSPWLFSRRADLFLFGGSAGAHETAFLLALLVPLLALPQATHYLLDAWIWKVRPGNETAAEAMGLRPVGQPRGSGAE